MDVTNTGAIVGKEVVQLYVADKTAPTPGAQNGRPLRELKGFEKVALEAGETKTVSFTLDKRSFAWYNVDLPGWYCASGGYDISVASSSRDIRLTAAVSVTSTVLPPFHVDMNTTMAALLADPRTHDVAQKEIVEKFDKITQTQNKGSQSSLAIDAKRRDRGFLERPIRNLYMITGAAYEDVVKLIGTFNGLTGG